MTESDALPALVRAFEEHEARGAELLAQVERHVRHMGRSYPPAWFVTGAKDDESVLDLAHRAFTVCARVEKGRFPFSGRRPFRAFVDERFDGRAIRYHSVYAKLSIARELMRDDYARNLRRDPVLRWRADLYGRVGDHLKSGAAAGRLARTPQGRGLPPRWSLAAPGLRRVAPPEPVVAALRSDGVTAVATIVDTLLRRTGPQSQSRLTTLTEAVLGTPPAEDPVHGAVPVAPPPAGLQVGVRRAVLRAWEGLDADDRMLLRSVARGESYDTLMARQPRLRHRVAATRAVTRVGKVFLAAVAGEAGLEDPQGLPAGVAPRQLVERVLAVLAEVVPDLFDLPPAPDGPR